MTLFIILVRLSDENLFFGCIAVALTAGYNLRVVVRKKSTEDSLTSRTQEDELSVEVGVFRAYLEVFCGVVKL